MNSVVWLAPDLVERLARAPCSQFGAPAPEGLLRSLGYQGLAVATREAHGPNVLQCAAGKALQTMRTPGVCGPYLYSLQPKLRFRVQGPFRTANRISTSAFPEGIGEHGCRCAQKSTTPKLASVHV